MNDYLGLQTWNQTKIGHIYFMRRMIQKQLFTHEVQVLASKVVFGHKWRFHDFDSRIKHQCNEIVAARIRIAHVTMREWSLVNMKVMKMLHKLVTTVKLRMALVTFQGEIARLSNLERKIVINCIKI